MTTLSSSSFFFSFFYNFRFLLLRITKLNIHSCSKLFLSLVPFCILHWITHMVFNLINSLSNIFSVSASVYSWHVPLNLTQIIVNLWYGENDKVREGRVLTVCPFVLLILFQLLEKKKYGHWKKIFSDLLFVLLTV